MGYTNSPLVVYTKLSPNHSGKRTHAIDRISPHCVVGQLTAESLGNVFASSSREASSNYGIDKDGRVGMYVEEKNRSWCTSSNSNDQRAVTIECASDTKHPYWMNDKVYKTLIDLCTDICHRNGKNKLIWFGDKNKSLNYEPKSNEMIITVHRWFANKSCPGDWLYARLGDVAKKVTENLSKYANNDTNGVTSDFTPTAKDTSDVKVSPIQNDAFIWQFFKAKGFNNYAIAGLMGNLKAESNLRPDNLQNSFEGRLGSDAEYVKNVDNGTYSKSKFANDHAGFGLAQWTWHTRKEALYDYAKKKGTSIADLNMQLEYLWVELQRYTKTMNVLRNAKSVYEASTIVLTDFEKPANQGNSVRNQRAKFGNEFYNKFANQGVVVGDIPTMKPIKLYRVQCGAFGVKANADKLANRLKKAGFDVSVKQIDTLYKVAIYDVASKKEADALASKIVRSKISKATVLEDD
jgi:hypothetical protein